MQRGEVGGGGGLAEGLRRLLVDLKRKRSARVRRDGMRRRGWGGEVGTAGGLA